jgi:hypothetical protein
VLERRIARSRRASTPAVRFAQEAGGQQGLSKRVLSDTLLPFRVAPIWREGTSSGNKLRTRLFEPEADLQTFAPPSRCASSSNSGLASFRSRVSKTFGEQVVDQHEEVMPRCTPDPARARRRSLGGSVGPIERDAVPIHLPVRY